MAEWSWLDSSLICKTNWLPSVLWHRWFGHMTCKNRPRYDLWCVWWDVKPYSINRSWSVLYTWLPLAISWSYHVIVAVGSDVGHSLCKVRWSGTCCLIISVIHRSASNIFDQHWRHSFSQCTGTRSAVEALCVMRYTSRQSSPSRSILVPSPRTDVTDSCFRTSRAHLFPFQFIYFSFAFHIDDVERRITCEFSSSNHIRAWLWSKTSIERKIESINLVSAQQHSSLQVMIKRESSRWCRVLWENCGMAVLTGS